MTSLINQPEPLQKEVDDLKAAMEKATETGEAQTIIVDGEKKIVEDPKHAGREIKPS